MHVGLAHFDIIEANDGVDDDWMGFGALAHHLAMDLRIGGNVDDEIAAHARLATEAASGRKRPALVGITLFDLVPWRDVIARGSRAMSSEPPLRHLDLAAPA